jgi:excisionase family DNA binding protein
MRSDLATSHYEFPQRACAALAPNSVQPIEWTRLDPIHSERVMERLAPSLTVRDVAAYLNVNEKTVYRLVQRRQLPGFKVAGAWRFRKADIERWVDLQKQVARDQAADMSRGSGR